MSDTVRQSETCHRPFHSRLTGNGFFSERHRPEHPPKLIIRVSEGQVLAKDFSCGVIYIIFFLLMCMVESELVYSLGSQILACA